MVGESLSEPDISVVIPTRNRVRSLRRTLAALGRQTYAAARFEVLVVANDCSDETGPTVRSLMMPYALRLIEIPTPGLSLARNTGAAAARGRVILFVDDDIEPLPDLIAAHAQAHESSTGLVAVGPLLAPPLPRPLSFFAERLRNLDAAFAALLASAQGPLDWFCMTGGNFSIPKALFLEAGGFDASMTTYGGEDYEFGCRVQKVGARFTFLPEAGGYHHRQENSSVTAYLRNGRSVGRNDVHIVTKHPEIIDRVKLGLVTRPQTRLGRLGRTFAFANPRLGDRLANGLRRAGNTLVWLRLRQPWNHLMDGLHQYWYFRGVADALGDYEAVAAYLNRLKKASDKKSGKWLS